MLDKKSDTFYAETQSLFLPQEETKPETKPELPAVENSRPDADIKRTVEETKTAVVSEAKPTPEETPVLQQVEAEQPEPAPAPQPAPVIAKKSGGSFFDELEAE